MTILEIEKHIVYIEWNFSLLANKLANQLKLGSNKCCLREDLSTLMYYIGVLSRWYNCTAAIDERCLLQTEVENLIHDAIRIIKKY